MGWFVWRIYISPISKSHKCLVIWRSFPLSQPTQGFSTLNWWLSSNVSKTQGQSQPRWKLHGAERWTKRLQIPRKFHQIPASPVGKMVGMSAEAGTFFWIFYNKMWSLHLLKMIYCVFYCNYVDVSWNISVLQITIQAINPASSKNPSLCRHLFCPDFAVTSLSMRPFCWRNSVVAWTKRRCQRTSTGECDVWSISSKK